MLAEKVKNTPSAHLGEGPVWDYRNNTLYWVDILGRCLYGFNPTTNAEYLYRFDQFVGAAVPCENNNFVLAMQHGFAYLDTQTKALTMIQDPESHLPLNRFNDGKCDPAGRFWAGTMAINSGPPVGSLYCLNNDLSITRKLTDIKISNGLDWTSDASKMYYIDTLSHKVRSFHYDKATGHIEYEKDFLQFERDSVFPDGMTLDEDNNLWIAFYNAGKVICFDGQNGKPVCTVEVPASLTTSCTFGGENLDTLFITSAAKGGEASGGGLFAVQPGVKGLKANLFRKNATA